MPFLRIEVTQGRAAAAAAVDAPFRTGGPCKAVRS
jgi:hypothetical protein